MPHYFAVLIAVVVWLAGLQIPTNAGAWLLPEGSGQLIAGIGYVEGSRRFDKSGNRVAAAAYRKQEASGYLEYGLSKRVNLILAPTFAHDHGAPAVNAVTGSTGSAFGARLLLWEAPWQVVSVQVLVQPGFKTGSEEAQIAAGGARNGAVDARVMYGVSFPVYGLPAFVDVQPGVRLRVDPFPSEARLDATFGIRPLPRVLLMAQLFNSFAPSRGPLIDRTSYAKAQASVVYDFTTSWSVQLGAFRTIAGRNAIQELGPFGAVWYRF